MEQIRRRDLGCHFHNLQDGATHAVFWDDNLKFHIEGITCESYMMEIFIRNSGLFADSDIWLRISVAP